MVALFTGTVDERDRRRQAPSRPIDTEDGEPDPEAAMAAEDETPDELPSLILKDVVPVHLLQERLTSEITIEVDAQSQGTREVVATERLMREHSGSCPLRLLVQTPNEVLLTLQVGPHWNVHPTAELLSGLREIWGAAAVRTKTRFEQPVGAA